VTALGVVADLVISAHAAPVGQGAVLLLLLAELALDDERLVGRLFHNQDKATNTVSCSFFLLWC